MGYMHINNLYKDQRILMFKECYSLEKIHGTSAHVSWNANQQKITYFSGGEKHEKFVSVFDNESLLEKFKEVSPNSNLTVYGEAYGGKCQGMSKTYGSELKFIGFDVKINETWLSVPNAEDVCNKLGLDFVFYRKVKTNINTLDSMRDMFSVQAKINGCGGEKIQEGVILRPLVELKASNGERIICKHKRSEFCETKTPREVSPEQLQILTEAKEIAEEWVTEMRLNHVLDKLPSGIGLENMKTIISSMVEDVYREAEGEIVKSVEVTKHIGMKTAQLFKQKLHNQLH